MQKTKPPARLKKALRTYRQTWESTNDVLYKMVRKWPGHHEPDEVTAKVRIIGRTYASGIERHASDGTKGIVRTLVASRRWLEPALRDLARRGPTPTGENLERIGDLHGRLLDKLSSEATRNGNKPRSFVSKYLHFHAQCFPIYDSLASRCIKSPVFYPWDNTWENEHPKPDRADPAYWRFCVRILRMAHDWRRAGIRPTARDMDTYLLAEVP